MRIVSLTITEGGYFYDAARDEVQLEAPGLAHDLEDPSHPTTAFGYLVEGLRRRRSGGVAPFTVLSCDNLHANGDVTGRVVTAPGLPPRCQPRALDLRSGRLSQFNG